MDDARALLDSLMGQTRNAGKDTRKKGNRGDGFKHDSVCKLYLIGFCPEHEKLFTNTRRDLGVCPKTHFEISKEEFRAHPDKKRYQAAYELQLLRHLTTILRRCDDWTVKEKQKNEDNLQNQKDHGAAISCLEAKKMKDMASKLLSEAEDLASSGDLEGSKIKVNSAQEYEKKAIDWEGKANALPEICEICGSIKENAKRSGFKHEAGKLHQGVLMIKKMLAELKEKEARGELKVDEDILAEERDAKEREADEREAKQREDRDRRRHEVSRSARADDKFNGKVERQHTEVREARDRRRHESPRSARAEDRSVGVSDWQNDRHGSRGSQRGRDDRMDRDNGRGRDGGRGRCEDGASSYVDRRKRRHEDDVSDRHADYHTDDGRKKRRREDEASDHQADRYTDDLRDRRRDAHDGVDRRVDQREPDADQTAESNQDRFKARHIQKKFMDLLVKSGAVTGSSTYEELEGLLGQKEDWQACEEAVRKELATEFIECIKKLSE